MSIIRPYEPVQVPYPMNERKRWLIVTAYAAAMALVESAAVLYLRTLGGRIQPYQPDPLPLTPQLARVELSREAATLAMIAAVGALAGRTWRSRLGYAAVVFGLWDILYYAFLRLMCGWPGSLADWDVLFLLPLPWWGPVWAPMTVAALMVGAGTLISLFDEPGRPVWPGPKSLALCFSGVALALWAFMAGSLRALPRGVEAAWSVLPDSFPWALFLAGASLMSAPLWDLRSKVLKLKSPG